MIRTGKIALVTCALAVIIPMSSCMFFNTEPEIPVEVRALDLYAAYNKNQVAADKDYKDKLLHVHGLVHKIGKLSNGTPFLVLDGGKADRSVGGILDTFGTQCLFPKDAVDDLAVLSKGDMVMIEGRCSGGMLRYVVISQCSLISVDAKEK